MGCSRTEKMTLGGLNRPPSVVEVREGDAHSMSAAIQL
jgi:hypothetical protein